MKHHTEARAGEPVQTHAMIVGPLSTAEWLLHAIGGETAFTDSVLGDLAEEYAMRAERDGARTARLWYAREALRSAPHLLQSAIRHGTPHARTRIATVAGALALFATLAVVAMQMRNGPPARLVADVVNPADGIIVNNVRPSLLKMRVHDEAGHILPSTGVQYRWTSGAPIAITPAGEVTCKENGDATVRASLGTVTTTISVLCRPVQVIRASTWIDFMAGDSARHLPYSAIGVDGRPVMQLRGSAGVRDSSIATLEGASIRPRAVGETSVDVMVGDRSARMQVVVHELVHSFANLRADQRFVAMNIRLARGDTTTLPLPSGVFWMKYVSRDSTDAPPSISVEGTSCMPSDGIRNYTVPFGVFGSYCDAYSEKGVTVKLAHGSTGAAVVAGLLMIERVKF
ncbi:MAG: hypothetical protein ABI625_15055 [bacterium]